MRQCTAQLTAMYHFAAFIAQQNNQTLDLETPGQYIQKKKKDNPKEDIFMALVNDYGLNLGTILDSWTTSPRFKDWVEEWNKRRGTNYSVDSWLVFIRSYADLDRTIEGIAYNGENVPW